MKSMWATKKGSQRTGVGMNVNAHGHRYSRTFSVTKDLRRRLQTKVSTSRFRDEVQGQGYYITPHTQLRATMEMAFRAYGCGNAASIRRPIGFYKDHSNRRPRVLFFFSAALVLAFSGICAPPPPPSASQFIYYFPFAPSCGYCSFLFSLYKFLLYQYINK